MSILRRGPRVGLGSRKVQLRKPGRTGIHAKAFRRCNVRKARESTVERCARLWRIRLAIIKGIYGQAAKLDQLLDGMILEAAA